MVSHVEKFSGVHVAMNACYDDLGEVSPTRVKKLTRFLINKGIQGVYVGGSTGEGVLQTVEERKKVLEAVVEENQDEITITAHIGAMTTTDSILLAKHAELIGVDAISSVPPFYFSYTEQAVKNYWLSLMDSTSLPFMIYHIPGSTGFTVTPQLLRELLEHNRLIGMKVTVFSTYDLQQFKEVGGPNFVVMNGLDQQFLAGRVMGADGGIGGTYGVMPELFLHIESCIRNGQLSEAQRWQFAVNDVITDIRELGLFGVTKELLKLRGVDCGKPRLPLPAILESRMVDVHKLYGKMMGYIDDLPAPLPHAQS